MAALIAAGFVLGFCLLDIVFWLFAAHALNKPVDPKLLEQERRRAPAVTDPRRLRNFLPLLLFTLVWTAIIGAFDAFLGLTIIQQLRALNYATMDGHITRCQLIANRNGNDGWRLTLQYTYQVQGQNYFSDQFRYLTTPQGTWADEIVAAHPVHSPVKVYYNPRDPADAILAPGVSGDDLHTALFFLPFNIAMVALWCMLVITVCSRRTRAGDPPAGIRVLRSEGMLRVPLPRVSPLLGTAGGTCLAAFLLGFMFPVDRPPVGLMLGLFVALRVFAQVLFSTLRRQLKSGKKDLVIDFYEQTVTLPQNFGRTEPVTIPLNELTIDVREIYVNGARWYAPVVRWTDEDGRTREEKLAEWWRERAQQFVCWLREEVECKRAG